MPPKKNSRVSPDDLLPLVELIYQAGLEPERWHDVLNGLVKKFDGSTTLFIQDLDTNGVGYVGGAGADPTFMKDYAEHFAAIHPARHLFRNPKVGTIIDANAVGDDFLHSEFFNDFFRPMDAYHLIGTLIFKDGPVTGRLALQRARRAGAYSEHERTDVLTLATHIRRSIEISRRLTAARWARDAASVANGYAFVDLNGRVLLADKLAETIFRAGDGITVVNGHLRATTSEVNARLRAMITAAAFVASGKGDRPGGFLGLPRRRREGPPLALLICPWHGNPVLFGIPGPAVLIFIEDPTLAPKPAATGAAALYGLTPAETRVLEAMLEGQRLSDYAAAAGVSLTTARTHLQSIFAKTGQRQQADLVRLILSSAIAHQS